jgi:hypothetical protein
VESSDGLSELVPHGQLLVAATFNDHGDYDPVIAVPSSEDTLPEPSFSVDGMFPVKLWAVNRFGDQNRSTLISGQFDSNSETERLYGSMTLETFYASTTSTDFSPPVIWGISSDVDENDHVTFAATVGYCGDIDYPCSEYDVIRVVATYTVYNAIGPNEIRTVELKQSETGGDPNLWTNEYMYLPNSGYDPIDNSETLEYYIQAVDEAGNVAISSKEAFHEIDAVHADVSLPIGSERTVTITLQQDLGDGNGPNPLAGAVAEVLLILEGDEPVELLPLSDSCSDGTASNGQCSVTFTSTTEGLTTLNITFSSGPLSKTFTFVTEWWAGTITLPKSVAFGNATNPTVNVCYTLTDENGLDVSRHCQAINSGNSPYDFEWSGLSPGTYVLTEDLDGIIHAYMKPITGIVVDDAHRDVQLQTLENRLEGCSPGYWKNHTEDWAAAGLDPRDKFNDVFDFINSPITSQFSADYTLDQAINASGGNLNKLARHGVAALLSARHPDVLFPLIPDGIEGSVIDMVQQGMATSGEPQATELASANVLGCPIN